MPDPRSTPEQDAEVRRLLAVARHDEPVPDAVAQRLDRVLADLRAESAPAAGSAAGSAAGPAAGPADAEPAPREAPAPALLGSLSALRGRRRTATRLLLAAAAVLVVGVGIGHLVGDSDQSSDSASSVPRESRADSADAAAGDAGGRGLTGGPAASTRALPAPLAAALPFRLSSTGLPAQLEAAAALAARAGVTRGTQAVTAAPVPGWSCPGSYATAPLAELLLPATYDGRAVLLRLSAPRGGRQQVDVDACGSGRTLQSLRVSAP